MTLGKSILMQEPHAGQLNRRVTIRLWTDNPNAAFGLTPTYSADYTCWAKVENVGAGIFFGTKQTGESVTHRIIVRYWTGVTDPQSITAEHVVESEGKRYRIHRVTDMNDARKFTALEVELLGAV